MGWLRSAVDQWVCHAKNKVTALRATVRIVAADGAIEASGGEVEQKGTKALRVPHRSCGEV